MSGDAIVWTVWLGGGLLAGIGVSAYLMASDADDDRDSDEAPPALIGFFTIFLWPIGVFIGALVAVGAVIHYTARMLVRHRVTAAERQRRIADMEHDLGLDREKP